MSDQDVTLRFNAEGAEAVKTGTDAIRDSLAASTAAAEALTRAADALTAAHKRSTDTLGEHKKALESNAEIMRQLRDAFQIGLAGATNFHGILRLLIRAATDFVSPLGMAALGVGALVTGIVLLNNKAKEAAESVERLMALSGLGARDAQVLAGTWERAGVSVGTLDTMLNRLGRDLEQGGQNLMTYGFSMAEIAAMSEKPGLALDKLRDKFQQLNTTARSQAIFSEFGRYAGVEAAVAFKLPQEQWEKYRDAAMQTVGVDEALIAKSRELALAQTEQTARMKNLALALAENVAIPVERWLLGIAEGFSQVRRASEAPGADEKETDLSQKIGKLARTPPFLAVLEVASKAFDISSRTLPGEKVEDTAAGWEQWLFQSLFGGFALLLQPGWASIQEAKIAEEIAKAEEQYSKFIVGRSKARDDKAAAAATESAAATKRGTVQLGGYTLDVSKTEFLKLGEEIVAIETEQHQKRLSGEAQFQAEMARLRDNNTAETLRQQIRLTEQEDQLANEKYARDKDLLQRSKKIGDTLTPEEETKLGKARDDVLITNEEKRRTTRLKFAEQEIVDAKTQADALTKIETDADEARLAVIEQDGKRRLAIVKASNDSELAIALQSAQIELDTARQTAETKLQENARETANVQAQVAMKQAQGFSTRDEQVQLAGLALQRIKVEQDMATKVVEARTKMVDELDKLARKEAQIGQQAIDLATRRLEAEQKAAAGPLRGEAAALQRQAERESIQADREKLGTIEDPEALRQAQRQLRIRELQAAAQAIEDQPISLDQEGVKAALDRMYQAAADAFARFASGGSILVKPGVGTEGRTDELADIRAIAKLREAMAQLGTASPGLADLQQLSSALQGLREKFVPTGLQESGAATAFPAGSAASALYSPAPAGSVLAQLLGTPETPAGGAPGTPGAGAPGATPGGVPTLPGAPNVPLTAPAIGMPYAAMLAQERARLGLDDEKAQWARTGGGAFRDTMSFPTIGGPPTTSPTGGMGVASGPMAGSTISRSPGEQDPAAYANAMTQAANKAQESWQKALDDVKAAQDKWDRDPLNPAAAGPGGTGNYYGYDRWRSQAPPGDTMDPSPDVRGGVPGGGAGGVPGGGAGDAGALGTAYREAFAAANQGAKELLDTLATKLPEAQQGLMDNIFREIKERFYAETAWDSARS